MTKKNIEPFPITIATWNVANDGLKAREILATGVTSLDTRQGGVIKTSFQLRYKEIQANIALKKR